MAICRPVFGFTQRAVREEVAVVFGTEIVASPRRSCPAIVEEPADDDNREDDKGTNEDLKIGKAAHPVLLVDWVFATASGEHGVIVAN